MYGFLAVILSDYYDLPFNDILDWRKFSVIVKERDVYQLKQILKDISDMEFIKLHKNLIQVQCFFFLHYHLLILNIVDLFLKLKKKYFRHSKITLKVYKLNMFGVYCSFIRFKSIFSGILPQSNMMHSIW